MCSLLAFWALTCVCVHAIVLVRQGTHPNHGAGAQTVSINTLAIGPYVGARIALVATNLLGDIKGEWWTDSADAAIAKAIDAASYPDTVIHLYDCATDGTGDIIGQAFARVRREGVGDVKYTSLR